MNSPLSLEDRLRAAVLATAAEIGPYDAPPPEFGAEGLDARGAGSGRRVQRPRAAARTLSSRDNGEFMIPPQGAGRVTPVPGAWST